MQNVERKSLSDINFRILNWSIAHAPFYRAECSHCDFGAPLVSSFRRTVIDDEGNEISLTHPGEIATLERVLGPNPSNELLEERLRFVPLYYCYDCLQSFEKKVKRSERPPCPKCGSANAKNTGEMIGDICPFCREGKIERVDTGIIS